MDYIEAILSLGLPVAIMSWWVHSWMYRNNLIDKRANHKETDEAVKEIRKTSKDTGVQTGDYWTNKWLRFGGGFYGLTALWTFIVIEAQEIWWLITNIPTVIELLSSGIFNVAIAFIKNQAMTFAQAFSWVVNWGGSGFSLIFFFSAYIGFYLGMKLASLLDIKVAIKKASDYLSDAKK